MKTVHAANLTGDLSSLSNASQTLLRQHRFPHNYDEKLDTLICEYHDHVMSRNITRSTAVFRKHMNTLETPDCVGGALMQSQRKSYRF